MEKNSIVCNVCPHACTLRPGQVGRCRVRGNINGENRDLNYGRITSLALDPIEKKPLANFYPGNYVLSLGSYGCNFNCSFCQNYSISMSDGSNRQYVETTPQIVVDKAVELIPEGNIGIAFTYNEPTIGYEFVLETEKLAQEKGLKTVVVTNGGINPEIFREIAKNTDAFNIDLKGIDIYKSIGGDLETVKENIRIAHEEGAHVEITTLVIPGINDSEEEIEKIAKFISSVDPNITLHLTRFFPQYKLLDNYPTPIETLRRSQKVAQKYLNNVILGNV